jgi:hypothetical protein
MGLVRNLKKTLTNLAERILVELSYHYIKQRAKQTLRKLDSYLPTTSSQKDLTTEGQGTTIATSSTGISEKTIMTATTEDIVAHIREWAIDKIELLHDADRHRNASALLSEFEEWIDPEGDELEIVSLESEDWTDEQEIDVR